MEKILKSYKLFKIYLLQTLTYSEWANPWFGTSLNVTCIPVYPSCDDTECPKNGYCLMFQSGPICLCEEGYSKYEDGSCLKPELETGSILCGSCDLERDQWTDWLNSDNPTGSSGDWETLAGFEKRCG